MGNTIFVAVAQDGTEWWGEWSTVWDAPCRSLCDEAAFRKWYREEYGRRGGRYLDERMERARHVAETYRIGAAFYELAYSNLLDSNRAGPHEEPVADVDALIRRYRWPGGEAWQDREAPGA